ncbi:hypothetical protein [Paraburkholderia gardini]|uniref:hypothetical protein n=1 Tax=Paraburkholderia gardini TaxID=2823469 RepID=UPI001DCB4A2B|nr:hypothetical protein [Paraburkholderia gardini]CAG4889487.1 hypothetical protein R69919_00755 [Paraburkholderia gardini]
MKKDIENEINKMREDIENMFAAYGVMHDGVKKIAEDIALRLRNRRDEDLTEHEKELINIARNLIDLLMTARAGIEKAAKHD